jgi:dTDP-glucose pyrophosphorylase
MISLVVNSALARTSEVERAPGVRMADPSDWRGSVVAPTSQLAHAIPIVARYGLAVAVDDQGIVVGTLADADIRSALLARVPLTEPITALLRQPGSGPPPAGAPALTLSSTGRLIGLVPAPPPAIADRLMVVLAGGRGTRLLPHTADCAKPLLPVAGRPILETMIEQQRQRGFRRFVLCVGYRAEMIERHFGDGSGFGVEISYVHDDGALGTAGPLTLLDPRPSSACVVLNGDVMTRAPLDRMMEFHAASGAAATVAVCDVELQVPFGVIELGGQTVSAIREKPRERSFVNAGIYVIEPGVLDFVSRGSRCDMPAVLARLIAAGARVGAFPLYETWTDVGTPQDLDAASAEWSVQP